MVVRKHGVFVVRVRFSVARLCDIKYIYRAHSKMVLRVHGMDEAGVRFPVGPQQKKLKPLLLAFFVYGSPQGENRKPEALGAEAG